GLYPPSLHDALPIYQKRDSKEAIANFKKKQKNLTDEIKEVSQMTDELLKIQDLETFISFFKRYEKNLSTILETPAIQEQLFADRSEEHTSELQSREK